MRPGATAAGCRCLFAFYLSLDDVFALSGHVRSPVRYARFEAVYKCRGRWKFYVRAINISKTSQSTRNVYARPSEGCRYEKLNRLMIETFVYQKLNVRHCKKDIEHWRWRTTIAYESIQSRFHKHYLIGVMIFDLRNRADAAHSRILKIDH